MQLSKLIIEPRVRSAWAAIDLGTLLARQFWWRGVALYLVLAIPVFVLARFTADIYSWLPLFVFWWFKPLYERPFLYLLSRELFSERVSTIDCLLNFKQWLFPSLLSVLTVRRLSTNRGMYAPVSLLEQPTASEYGKRTGVLGLKFSNASTCLTFILHQVETVFAFAIMAFIFFILPDFAKEAFGGLFGDDHYFYLVWSLLLFVPFAIIAPFYCAAGFCLYICRRIELEGWDMEICFREWMQNYTPLKERSAGAVSE